MAPIQIIDKFASVDSFSIPDRVLRTRDMTSKSLTTAILVLAIISVVFFLSVLFVLARIWKQMVARKLASRAAEAVGAVVERKTSDWARKNSNVLWSMYIQEDDLKTQFSLPPKSRLFSIGSASSDNEHDHGICPLDRHTSDADETNKNKTKSEESVDNNAPRSRIPYPQETTPTKNLSRTRARSQPCHHRPSDSLEHVAKRKQSMAEQEPRSMRMVVEGPVQGTVMGQRRT
ncbi:hypothetical protein A1O3_07900 [Capronia epimyces CBS 606.96]|uniref:Uncharacterized protein n=1 Tax=Capronia epimyces CBS 606.96 TaxID=1182542 RepID=W9XRK2_9EURO|nr:uncharacterized protein A1O3_07900 [Capronia epimyces CBS 606.96]EXJ79621.1 hypothetical protein A1O3_07900 [Capronia epimyces CBS 606.96]